MEKKIVILAVCISVVTVCGHAQQRKQVAPPPPPPPPMEMVTTPPPPPPPPPPTAPEAPAEDAREIVNNNGYDVSVQQNNGNGMVVLKKDGVTRRIKLSTWNANRKYYEKKYGQLPPPPPPPPAPPTPGDIKFTAPIIQKDA